MGKITVETCGIEGLKVIVPAVFGDERGYFMETYHYEDYKAAGIDQVFVQDNQSSSRKGVLRGLHFQKEFPQDKLVRVISGEVFDVAVDLREGSSTFGQWFGVTLSAENKKQFFIRIMRNLHINVRIFITLMTKGGYFTTIRRLVWNGRFRRGWNWLCQKKIKNGAA